MSLPPSSSGLTVSESSSSTFSSRRGGLSESGSCNHWQCNCEPYRTSGGILKSLKREHVLSDEFWFPEGTVILASREDTLFRVHKDVMSIHSELFKTMFSLPQPVDGSDTELFEGCPVIRLDDLKADIQSLLKVIYFPTYLRKERIPFYPALGALRMATKYDFDEVRSLSIARLSEIYPATLSAFDLFDDPKFVSDPGVHVAAIKAALECDLPSLLPVAMYRCAALSSRKFEWALPRLPTHLTQELEDGRAALIFDQCALSFQFIHNPHAVLSNAECARRNPEFCLQLAMDTNRGWLNKSYFQKCIALHRFTSWSEARPDGHNSICETCRAALKQSHEKGRQEIWRLLPDYFGLGTWTELERAAV